MNEDDCDDSEVEESNVTNSQVSDTVVENSNDWIRVNSTRDLPKKDAIISCRFPTYDHVVKCRVLSRGGKASASNWHFLNILEDGKEAGRCCSFKDVIWKPGDINVDGTGGNRNVDGTGSNQSVDGIGGNQSVDGTGIDQSVGGTGSD